MNREQLGEWLSAYLDGELTEGEAAIIERALEEDPDARTMLEELRHTASVVSSLPRHRAPASILDDLRFQVERAELLDDTREAAPKPISRGPRPAMRWAMAATIGFAAIGAMWMMVDQERHAGTEMRIADGEADSVTEGGDSAVQPAVRRSAPLADMHVAAAEKGRGDSTPPAPGAEVTPPPELQLALAEKETGAVPGRSRRASGVGAASPGMRGGGRSEPEMFERLTDSSSQRKTLAPADAAPVENILSVKQKLARGMSGGELRDHQFANEPVRLEVRTKDAASRDRLERALLAQLAAAGVTDLKSASADATPDRFFLAGTAGVNYKQTDRRQVLVRAPAEQIERIVDVVGEPSAASARMALVIGDDMRIKGRRKVADTFRLLEAGEASTEETEEVADSDRVGGAAGGETPQVPWIVEGLVDALAQDNPALERALSKEHAAQPTDDAEEVRKSDTFADASPPTRAATPGRHGMTAAAEKKESVQPGAKAKKETPAAQPRDDVRTQAADDRPSLVKRRMQEAQRIATAQKRADAAKAAPAPPADASAATAGRMEPQPLVTLVVEFIPPEPARTRAAPPTDNRHAEPATTLPARRTQPANQSKRKQ